MCSGPAMSSLFTRLNRVQGDRTHRLQAAKHRPGRAALWRPETGEDHLPREGVSGPWPRFGTLYDKSVSTLTTRRPHLKFKLRILADLARWQGNQPVAVRRTRLPSATR